MNIDEAQELPRYSSNATLYPCERRDAFILCRLRRRMTYEETDELLLGMGEQGGGLGSCFQFVAIKILAVLSIQKH